ncbi:putative disease resistance RPP13-like protein 1 [Beta vulgaris subsp. vulgaris]|uniref:putative disease resistance RPP13-like protein 1 n=1 Tax=Beta vulgaris subsp. vulgaris TaxID=3555 RepID=UPI002036C8BD|nr:putative disease resistance RPP13-like protein 1 [Beta vulgaris subsp. vulgaris]
MEIAGVFISPLLQVVFEKLVSAGIRRFLHREEGIQPQVIDGLQSKLRYINAVLSDAEQKQFRSETVKLWLQDLQYLAYDLEDIFDGFTTDARLQELNDGCSSFCFPSRVCSCFKFRVQSSLSSASGAPNTKSANYSASIEQMSKRLEDIMSRVGTLGLLQQTHSREEQREERTKTSSLVREPILYGRHDEKNQIIRRLLSTDEPCFENYIVIPLVGQGGIGKTTLAQTIYNDEQVTAHFDIKAWVCVSDVFDVKQITTSMISSVSSPTTHSDFSSLNDAQDKLKNLLVDKRSLIVLDDIWSDEYDPWDQLQTPFLAAKKGSRVLITTRMEKVAKNMVKRPTESPTIKLKVLSDDHCWLLFKQHAHVDDDLDEMRNELVELFKGLPLAAKALGGLLRKHDRSSWSRILKNNNWSEKCGVLPALRLSYHHLPQTLKRAFAYCSIFPKDHKFKKTDLVLMWKAEGLLPEHDKECMEDISRDYFLDLVSRSLFEPSLVKFYDGCFIMHDLIHDLAQWAAGEVCCTMNIQKLSSSTRYWSFSKEILEDQTWTSKKLVQVRSFASFGAVDVRIPMQLLDSLFDQFQYLRLLSMRNAGIIELPNSFGSLKHLRLVDLSENRALTRLPKSTSKLCNLHMLLLRECYSLAEIVPLIELQHLDVSSRYTASPSGIGKLTNLQTLKGGFHVRRKSGTRISELKNLKCLRGSLDIHGLENVFSSEEAQAARLHEKTGLDKLKMYWGDGTHDVDDNIKKDVLDRLEPPESIQILKLKGYDGLTFPAWLGNPSYTNMVVIKLEDCRRCEFLPALGQLPSLKKIRIEGMDVIKTVGSEFYGNDDGCSNPFPALKSLEFFFMNGWKEWLAPSVDNNNVFPCLEYMTIYECQILRGNLPSHLPSLKELYIESCKELRLSLSSCPLLQTLHVVFCDVSIADCLPSTLETLEISHSKIEQPIQEWKLDLLTSLKSLTLENIGSYADTIEYIPQPYFHLPSSLSYFCIREFKNLKTLSCSDLPNLTQITIWYCEKLESLGVDFPPPKLQKASIRYCPLIYQRCQRDPDGLIVFDYMDDKYKYSYI